MKTVQPAQRCGDSCLSWHEKQNPSPTPPPTHTHKRKNKKSMNQRKILTKKKEQKLRNNTTNMDNYASTKLY